ncbi:unnamed protein product [Spirodela intermedia]|uniref:Uncharacterized protein n=1 Tax=Spirodela intermedia TaxID=51605 RepID=A0A7I8K4I5_SPIIN|nr:unnamed protein product [Spirodela intermedia]
MPRHGDATEGESSLAASGAVKGPGDAGYPGTFPVLNKTNYPVWAMHMELHLEAHSLWDAIESKTIARKKDRQALSVMLGAVSEDIQTQLDIAKMAKETWELFKATYVGVTRLTKSRLQGLRQEFEMFQMRDDEAVTDFAKKPSRVVTQIRNLGEKLEEGVVVAKLLRVTPRRFNPITASLKQFGGIDSMPFEEAVGSLKIYKEKLKSRQQKREEQVLFSHEIEKTKGGNPRSRGRGRGHGRGRGRGRSNGRGSDENWKPDDKSTVKCYNCDKMGHF